MEKGAIYARVSTNESDGLQDPTRQLEDCRERLRSEGVTEFDVFAEHASGADKNRESLEELFDSIRAGEYDCVCMSEVSRLARRTSLAAEFIDVCIEEREIPIYLTDEMIDAIHPENPMSAFFAKQIALWAEEDRRQILRRIESGLKHAQREGKWTSRPPVGFKTDGEGYLRVDLEEFTAVRVALTRVLEGDSMNSVEKDTGISRRTLGRVLDDDDRLRLYFDTEADDDRVKRALESADVDRCELPDTVENRIREIVRDELEAER